MPVVVITASHDGEPLQIERHAQAQFPSFVQSWRRRSMNISWAACCFCGAHPYDTELKELVTTFAVLLRAIVQTIDRRGLKRRFLRKHLVDVDRFYRKISETPTQSEAALKLTERFEKNRNGLFTFLTHDGIPWNNNNAEHAVKAFARLRRPIVGLSTAKGIDEYLVLLSICQTCKYSGLDFLDFLLSGEKDVGAYAQKRGKRSAIADPF